MQVSEVGIVRREQTGGGTVAQKGGGWYFSEAGLGPASDGLECFLAARSSRICLFTGISEYCSIEIPSYRVFVNGHNG